MAELKRQLTLFDLSLIAIGSVIGSGIFLTPSLVFQALPSPSGVLALWVFIGLAVLCGALTYGELGAMMPGAGGIYIYLSRAYGNIFGFLYGWIYFTVVNTGSMAALSIAFATYLGYFVKLSDWQISLAAVSGLLILTVINILGVKAGAIFSDLFTILKIAGIAVLIVAGFTLGSPNTSFPAAPLESLPGGWPAALALAMVGVMWSYGGWHHTSFLAGEAIKPRRNVPAAMIIGAAAVVLIYCLTNLAYLFLLTPAQIAGSPRVAADAMVAALGAGGGTFIALAIFISTFGTSGIYTMAAPRIYFAMAQDGVFFKKVAEVHPRFHTPAFAIFFQSLWACVLILFWGTFEKVISYVVFTDAIFFSLTAASVFVFRFRVPQAERPYRTLGYPLTPLIFIAMNTWFILNTIFRRPMESIAGIGFVLLGIPVYYFWRRRQTTEARHLQSHP